MLSLFAERWRSVVVAWVVVASGCGSTTSGGNPDGAADRPAGFGGAGGGGAGGRAGASGGGTAGGGGSAGKGGAAGHEAPLDGGAAGSAASGSGGAAGSGGAGTVSSGGAAGTVSSGGAAGTVSSGGAAGTVSSGGAAGTVSSGGAPGTGGAPGSGGAAGSGAVLAGDSVLMNHNSLNRSGVYVQPTLTKAVAATLKPDTTFNATFSGVVYGQPLFVDGLGGTDMVIVATEEDTVHAFDAVSGDLLWMTSLGQPVPLATMPCGNIDPLGVTGTPVIDLQSRTLFVAAMVTPDAGSTKQWEVFALSIDDGSLRPGWPVDMASSVTSGTTPFVATAQGQRGALALVNGILYVPFGGLAGDCGSYHGWLVAISIADPTQVQGWATAANGGGIWGASGVSSDGSNVYVTTGNTFTDGTWGGGEAVLRFPASLPLTATPDYWAPTNWPTLDFGDADLGSSGPVVFDLPGGTPSHLALALGKDGNAYLADANNLGGIADPVAKIQAANSVITSATALYTTPTATYAAFLGAGSNCTDGTAGALTTLKIVPGSPPSIAYSWCAVIAGSGSPMVTTTDGQSDAVVWVVQAEGNNLMWAFDGDTGARIFAATDPVPGARRYNSPIAAKGRIFVAGDGLVVAFTP